MSNRLFEYAEHWLVRRKDTPNLHIYWCRPGSRRVRRKSANTDNLEEAKHRLIEFVNAKKRPKDARSPDEVSVHDALNEYIERTLDGRSSQRKAYGILRLWSAFFDLEDIQFVSELTLDAQDRYIDWRRERLLKQGYTASNGTIQRELTVLRASLKAFWKRGYLSTVPYIRSLPQPAPRQRFLSHEEFERLLAECHEPHSKLFVLLAIHTLQRPGAIFDLTVEQVNLNAGTIDFLPPWREQSKKRRPVVTITKTLRPHLEKAIAASVSGFIVERGGLPIKSIRTSFNRAKSRAGLGKDVMPYTLRHTGATWLAAAGVPLRQIAGMLGHSELKTTELYAKHAPQFLADAASALDAICGAVTNLSVYEGCVRYGKAANAA